MTSFRLLLAAALAALVLVPGTGSASAPGRAIDDAIAGEGPADALPGDADGDGVLDDEDNCPDWPNAAQGLPSWSLAGDDFDCDGFGGELESYLDTSPSGFCPATPTPNDEPTDPWPTDFNDNGITNLPDVISFGPTFNKLEGQLGYDQRHDLNNTQQVLLSDVILMGPFFNKNCLPPPPSSEFLIAEALDAGEITYEDSLRYRAYALFQTPGLPAEFESPVIQHHAAVELFAEVLENEATLSPQLLADLEPYRARPADPLSIFSEPPAQVSLVPSAAALTDPWVNLAAAGGKVRVWSKTSDAAILPDRMAKVDQLWPKLQAVFPFNNPDTPGAPSINPDSAIDIYFVDVGILDPRWQSCDSPPCLYDNSGGAYTNYVAPFNGNASSSSVLVDKSVTGTSAITVIAHELAHVGQHSYDTTEPFWLKDATAQWAAERVLMELNLSQTQNFQYLPGFFEGLNTKLVKDVHPHRYGSWLYFFHASMDQGDGIVTNVWQQAAAPGQQNENAVDLVYPFVDNFDDFATHNWNQPPVEKVFPLYKGPLPASPLFPTGLKPKLHKPTKNFTTTSEEVNTDRPAPLSARYYRYTFANNIRKVTFHNDTVANQDAHIWAIYKIAGQWKTPEDWSRNEKQRFCRDFPDEDIQELILVFSNSHKTTSLPAGNKYRVKADTESCKGFIGTSTGTYHHTCDVEFECYTADWTVTANILWEEDEDYFFGCGCRPFFPTGEIDWSWSFSYPDPYCFDSESGHLEAGVAPPYESQQMLILWEDADDMSQWFYSASGGIDVSWYDDCENGTGTANTPFIAVPVPDVTFVTPTLPPTMPPIPPGPAAVAVPVPFGGGEQMSAAATAICQETEFSFPRDANTFSGSCVDAFNTDISTVSYQWSFTRIGGVP